MKLYKGKITLLLLFTLHKSFTQNKVFFVFDKTTNSPIENVNIFYPELNEGTFTNSEGKASINLKKSALKISNIGYEDFILETEREKMVDTLFIIPKTVELDEIIIKSFDLNKALKYVLDNYKILYVNKPFEKQCNFKETVQIDNRLKRLILTEVNWWDKTYELKNKSDLKLRLGKINFSKNIPLDIYADVPRINDNKSGYVVPNSLINAIYLNRHLSNFITFSKNIVGVVEESPADQVIVSFETDWETLKEVSSRSQGKIVFDKKTKAILEFTTLREYKDNFVRGIVKENNKESITETKEGLTRLTFYKTYNDQWTLKSFESKLECSTTYDGKIHPSVFENSIYVLKEIAINKVNNDGLIDLTKPIYQSLPSETIVNTNSILLNKMESDFIENE